MAAKSRGVSKAGKAGPAAGSNGAAVAVKVKPLPPKVVRNLAALGEPHRLAVLEFLAMSPVSVTLTDIAGQLSGDAAAGPAVDWLKRHGWLASERVPKASGGGWRYRLSDAGRERLTAIGG